LPDHAFSLLSNYDSIRVLNETDVLATYASERQNVTARVNTYLRNLSHVIEDKAEILKQKAIESVSGSWNLSDHEVS
jgi:hypothetical protein